MHDVVEMWPQFIWKYIQIENCYLKNVIIFFSITVYAVFFIK